jgi:acetylglutamate kinase
MSDVPGLMRDPTDASTLFNHITTGEIDELKRIGVIDKGMIPKMESAVAAIRSGVEKVSLVDGRVPHSVLLEIFTDAGVGTELVA